MIFRYKKKIVSLHDGHLDAEGVLTEDEKEMLSKELYSGVYEKLEKEPIEPFTADEANEMAHKYVENAFEELKSNIIESIKSNAGVGRFKTIVNTLSEDLAIKACEYMRDKGYKVTYKSNDIYGHNHTVFGVSYTIDISWSDSDECLL